MMPDVEAELTAFLRADPTVAGIVGPRVYTEIPNNPTWPLVRLTRASSTTITGPLWSESVRIELSVYGGPKATARTLADACRSALAGARGVHGSAVFTWVRFGAMSWIPDPAFEPQRPRYVVDFAVSVHPAP